MAKLYDGVGGVCRNVAKAYDGVSGVARKTLKAYDGVNGVARLYFNKLYTWAKYTSYVVSSAYEDYEWEYDERVDRIWNLSFAIEHEYCEYLGDGEDTGVECRFITYDDVVYDNSTGDISLTGREYFYKDESDVMHEYEAEENLVGRYVYTDDGVRFVRAAELWGGYVYYLDISELAVRGRKYYTYAYRYVEDVQSSDPDAYSEGSTAGYTSHSSNDIRTVYVRVERD